MGKDNELMTAVKEANRQNVRKILHKYRRSHKKNSVKKSNINVVDADGFTVLHHAALNGDVEIVMAIVEMEGDPNSTDQKGMTPLHLAAWAGKDLSVKALLESRALPNLPAHSGDTPLHLAAQHGYAACTKILLNFHADGTFRNDNKETPLDLACQFGHTAVVKQLITDHKVINLLMTAMSDQRFKSPLHLSAKSGHDDIVHLLLQGGANVNEARVEGTPLHQAALYGKTDVVRLLLRAGADASVKNSHGLMPLDLVNRFTTSRAGLEIKQMLREAVGDHVAYARAVSDYHNQYDDTCLSFKVGDSIAVLEQNENGRWQGYVVNSELERVGYFPAMAVQLITKNKNLLSTSSAGSQTSMESGSGSSYPPSTISSPEKRLETALNPSAMAQPVGVVPIGSFEVVTLAQANPESHAPPKQTACGSVPPRMSSFKQKKSTKQSPQNSPCINKSRLSEPVSPPHQTSSLQARTALFQRSKSEDRCRKKNEPPSACHIDPNILNRLSPRGSPGQSPVLRSRDLHSHGAQYEFANSIRQRIQSHSEGTSCKSRANQSTVYADVHVMPSRSSSEKSSPTYSNYNTAYFCDNNDGIEKAVKCASTNNTDSESVTSSNASYDKSPSPRKIKPILIKSRSIDSNKTPSASDTEGSTKNGNTVKFAQSPEEKRQCWANNSHEAVNPFPQHEHSMAKLNHRQILIRSNTEGAEPFSPNYDLTIRKAPKNRSNTDVQENVFSFPVVHSSSSSPHGNVSPRNHGSPKNARPYSSPETHGSWNSSKTSGSSSPKTPESPLTGSRLSSSSLSPMTPVFDDEPKYPSNQKLNEEDQKVLDWLVDLKLASYFYNFQSHGFDMTSIRAITPEDLNIMDIKKTGHRKKLLSEVAKLPPSNDIPKIKPDDVGSWLANLNLQQYEQNFFEGGFDDIDFLKDLDKNDLDMIDIKKKGHQKKILMAVQQLGDMELTAVLDEVVAETPIKRGVSVNGRNHSDQILQEFFPSNFQTISKAASSQHSSPAMHDSEGRLLDHPPTHFASSSTPIENGPPKIPPPVAKKTSTSNAPKPKPKPTRCYSNSYAVKSSSSSSDSINEMDAPRKSSLNSSGKIQGDQDDMVTSSKSRNFFKEQERKLSISSNGDIERKAPSLTSSLSSLEESPSNTIRRNTSIPPPILKPKPKISITDNEKSPTGFKPPPPAPPKRLDSIKASADINGSRHDFPYTFDVDLHKNDNSEEAPALPVKARNSSENGSLTKPTSPSTPISSTYHSASTNLSSPLPEVTSSPAISQSSTLDKSLFPAQLPPNDISPIDNKQFTQYGDNSDGISDVPSPLPEKNAIDEAFGETDNLLSDLMADIDDFSAQLDAMF